MNQTVMRERIFDVLYEAVDEVNAALPEDKRLSKAPEGELVGPATTLDSLGLVNLVFGVEVGIEAAFGVPVALLDERGLGQEPNPFRTVGLLAEYV